MNPVLKRFTLLFMVVASFADPVSSQFRIGLRGGIYSAQIKDLNDGVYDISFSGNRRMGFLVGLVGQLEMGDVFIQPELLYCNIRNDITKGEELTELDIKKIDLPVMLGYKLGSFKIQAGPVASVVIHDNSQLTDFAGYDLLLERATIGFQAGVGVDISRLSLDFKYEGSLSKVFDGIKIGNNVMEFDARTSHFLFSIGLFFND